MHLEHRGWKLQASWYHSFSGDPDGWVCYATAPTSSHKLNIGRWGSSELALENGRAYVDRRIDTPARVGGKAAIQRRRQ